MFYARNVNTILKTTSSFVSTIRSKRFNKGQNDTAGIGLRQKLFKGDDNLLDLDVDVDNFETDFMNVRDLQEDHITQVKLLKEREKYLIVKRKYFKEKMPNFLTYSEKQQIKYLHTTDPEIWTIEKLSEGFPALPATINVCCVVTNEF